MGPGDLGHAAAHVPPSLKVTLHQLRMGRTRDYDEMVTVEYRLSQSMTARPDFREGIRAVLVDKDNKPRWHPAILYEVADADVVACFAPVDGDELELELPEGKGTTGPRH